MNSVDVHLRLQEYQNKSPETPTLPFGLSFPCQLSQSLWWRHSAGQYVLPDHCLDPKRMYNYDLLTCFGSPGPQKSVESKPFGRFLNAIHHYFGTGLYDSMTRQL